MNSFVEKLEAKTDARNVTSLLRQSRAAAAFDAVVALALAYDEILLQVDEFALRHQNISQVLNETLSTLKFNGLSVNGLQNKYYCFLMLFCFVEFPPFLKISRSRI